MTINYENLTEFVQALEAENELIRIHAPVSSHLEITEITDRVSKSRGGGKALLFEKVEGSPFPLLINAFGSPRRIALALGTPDLEDLRKRLQDILAPNVPKNLRDKLALLRRAFSIARFFPKVVFMNTAPCQEVIRRGDDIDLGEFPILKCWPDDGGPFITLPVVFTKSLVSGKRNAGMYRMQVFDRNTTGMHWHVHKDGAHFFREYERAGKRMEVAVAIGTDPAITYAATAPLPPGIDELLLAGFIRQKPVKLTRAITVDMEIPAEAEIILEGYVDPAERRLEGPFGDHTGYYSLADDYPVFHVTAITHRKRPLYSASIVGRPPMEDCYLALATERIFLPLIRTIQPEIADYWLPWEGVFHNIVVVSIKKEYPGQARKVMQGLWGSGQMSFCKTIVVVDADSPLGQGAALIKSILSQIDLTSDIFLTDGILDALDHAAPGAFFGGKLGIDATARLGGEPPRRQSVPSLSGNNPMLPVNIVKALDSDIADCRVLFDDTPLPLLMVKVRKTEQKRGIYFRDLLLDAEALSFGIIFFYDAEIDLEDLSLLAWKAFNNVDPQRDITIRKNVALVDATKKTELDGHFRPWPDDLVNTHEIVERVNARWQEYGIPL